MGMDDMEMGSKKKASMVKDVIGMGGMGMCGIGMGGMGMCGIGIGGMEMGSMRVDGIVMSRIK